MRALYLIIFIVIQTSSLASAFAVAAYEAPCRFQEENYLHAKGDLEKCVELLSRMEGRSEPSHSSDSTQSVPCLSELKVVDEKVLSLNACRIMNRY